MRESHSSAVAANTPKEENADALPQNRPSSGSVALDQWRGVALVFDLISHGYFFTGRVDGIGRVGVNLFFFISGILVFQSLSRMKSANAWQRTIQFWWRRLRRLYPALLAYVIVMLPVVFLQGNRQNLPPYSDFASYLKAIPFVLGYMVNYYPRANMALGHLWSLACEMQFYLAAPLLFWAGGNKNRRRVVVFSLILAALLGAGLLQPLLKSRYPALEHWKYHFEFAVWPMMAGFYCEFRAEKMKEVLFPVRTAVFRLGILLCLASFLLMVAGYEVKLMVIATGALLIGSCYVSYVNSWQLTGVSGVSLKWLGERTYSIYLWQQPLSICRYLPNYLHPLGACLAGVFGAFWFRRFEQPFISASRKKSIT